jgi:hypothetical protein
MKMVDFAIIASMLAACIVSCSNNQSESFQIWYEQQSFSYYTNSDKDSAIQYQRVRSKSLAIDTLYRSMQGPLSSKTIYMDEGENELIWLTGYNVKIRDDKTGAPAPA